MIVVEEIKIINVPDDWIYYNVLQSNYIPVVTNEGFDEQRSIDIISELVKGKRYRANGLDIIVGYTSKALNALGLTLGYLDELNYEIESLKETINKTSMELGQIKADNKQKSWEHYLRYGEFIK